MKAYTLVGGHFEHTFSEYIPSICDVDIMGTSFDEQHEDSKRRRSAKNLIGKEGLHNPWENSTLIAPIVE